MKNDVKKIIAVDLDGTLLDSDFLIEIAFAFVRENPINIFKLFMWLVKGKAYLKSQLSKRIDYDITNLPYNRPLLDWLHKQKKLGCSLVLVTATHERYANLIADHLGIFDTVYGTTSELNLSSYNKRDLLVNQYGKNGFEYIGNAMVDIPIWQVASKAHVVNPELGVCNKVHKYGNVGMVFNTLPGYIRSLLKALRLHQWAKNSLIFVTLAASHQLLEIELLLNGFIAFVLFGLCASGVYLLNDLLDLEDDRHHSSKCNRPLASGAYPIKHAIFLIPFLLLTTFYLSWLMLPAWFTLVLGIYYILTVAYSFWLKRVVMMDVITLALLYTIRIVAGAAAFELEITFWILAFSFFIFLSLALVKRYTELHEARNKGGNEMTRGRGYYPSDLELLSSLGSSSGYVAVLVLALYIQDATTGSLYQFPELIWLACPLLLFWISRVWLLSHRGEMYDDPVLFAVKDKVSRLIGILFVTVFIVAA